MTKKASWGWGYDPWTCQGTWPCHGISGWISSKDLNHIGVSFLSQFSLSSEILEAGTGVASWQMWVGCNIASFQSQHPTIGLKTRAKPGSGEQASAAPHLTPTWLSQPRLPTESSVTPSQADSHFQPWAPLFPSLRLVLMAVPATCPLHCTPKISDLGSKFFKNLRCVMRWIVHPPPSNTLKSQTLSTSECDSIWR